MLLPTKFFYLSVWRRRNWTHVPKIEEEQVEEFHELKECAINLSRTRLQRCLMPPTFATEI